MTPAAPIAPGTPRPPCSLAGYREARNRPQYDLAPGNQSFVMIRESSGDVSCSVVYVENRLGDLEAQVGARR